MIFRERYQHQSHWLFTFFVFWIFKVASVKSIEEVFFFLSPPRLLSFLVYHKGHNDFSCWIEEQSSMVEANRLNLFDGSCTKPSLGLISVIQHSQHSLSSVLSTLQEDMLYQSTAVSIKATRAQNTFFFP